MGEILFARNKSNVEDVFKTKYSFVLKHVSLCLWRSKYEYCVWRRLKGVGESIIVQVSKIE